MKVKFISENTKEAHLANRRVVLFRDEASSDHDADVLGILIEEWNNEERKFQTVDSVWGLYFYDVKASIVDIVRKYNDIDCFIFKNDRGAPKKWKDNYREFDVASFS